jgi:general secretion pathway protein D
MNASWRRLRGALAGAAIALGLAACAAHNLNTEGMKLIESGQRTQGLALLARASDMEPTNSRYRIDYLKQQQLAVRDLLARADEALAAGQLEPARELYLQTLAVQPGNDRARRGVAAVDLDLRHRVALADAEKVLAGGDPAAARAKLRQLLLENPAHAGAQRVLVKVDDAVERIDEAARQKAAAASVLKKPVTLQFRDANLRMVFEALSRTTGLNVILDRDVRADLKTTIFVRDASVGDSVDLILLQNQLEKKVLNANTLFIYPATSAKHKEYQDLKVRTFQVSNADAKYLQTVLKTVLKVKDVALDERTNTLVIRDSSDAVAIAEKVIAAHDVPDPEVMLEVEVLEVTRDRLSDIGILWPDNATISTPPEAETIGAVRDLGTRDLLITPLSIGFNLKLQDTNANLLASPRIRARHREKARIMIGDKVPVITNSVTPIQTGSAVVTGTVQYLDVGIKLEVEPHVYGEGDVGIRLNLEVSNIVREVRNLQSGTLAYQIGTRSAQTNLRLRDGETQILGGLISDQDRNTASKVPGLGELPVLGRLFSSHANNGLKSEIILSITPRLVRGPVVAAAGLRDVYSGTDASMRQVPLRLDPIGAAGGVVSTGAPLSTPRASRPSAPRAAESAAGRPGAAANAASADTTAAGTPPSTDEAASDESPEPAGTAPAPDSGTPKSAPPSAAAPPARSAPAGGDGAAPPPAVATPGATAAGRGVPAELVLQGPASVRVGDEFTVTLEATFHEPLTALPLIVRFDPQVVAFVDAQPEGIARAGGIEGAAARVDAVTGRVDVELQAAPNANLAGQGKLLTLRFAARTPRAQTRVSLGQVTLPGGDGPRTIPRPPTLLMRVAP